MTRLSLAGATVVASALLLVVGPATASPSSEQITGTAVGSVKLGEPYAQLHAAGLVGPIGSGCSLNVGSKAARLRAPLTGNVQFGSSKARTVTDISVSAGANARGVTVGGRLSAIRAAYRDVKVDRSTEKVFGIDVATVHPSGGGKISFAINDKSHKVILIGVPDIPFCD
ncbi:MAG: hypothetical protein ACYDHH_19630 [Solirubrobacteraceae bacterium]